MLIVACCGVVRGQDRQTFDSSTLPSSYYFCMQIYPHPPLNFRLFGPPSVLLQTILIVVLLWVYYLSIVVWVLVFGAPNNSKIGRGGCHRQNGPTSGSSAPPTVIPCVYDQNPLEGVPQQSSRWCRCCLGWRWSVHAPAIFDLASWCCAMYFAPQTAATTTIRGEYLRLCVLNQRRLVWVLGWPWFGREWTMDREDFSAMVRMYFFRLSRFEVRNT